MKKLLLLSCLWACRAGAQELYVFSEPASNMPARSVAIKQTARFLPSGDSRHMTELMFGASRDLMVHVSGTVSNMYSPGMRPESMRLYAKYRFLSNDNLYTHFRMAAFAEVSGSRNDAMYDELSLDGDRGGVQAGLVATQLLHKVALSATLNYTDGFRSGSATTSLLSQAMGYSFSAGYLVFPKHYTRYTQTNLNLYAELLGQQGLDRKANFTDLAPAVQLIFNSAVKLNAGYRFQLWGNMSRMSDRSVTVAVEWLFLNVWRHSSK